MTETETKNDGWEWMIVEIMGHRKHAGRVREEERFGVKMLRIDVPLKGDPAANGWETQYYGAASILSITMTDEASAMEANRPWEPPSRYRLPKPETEPVILDGERIDGESDYADKEDDG